VNGGLDLSTIRRVTAARSRIVGATELNNLTATIFNDFCAGD